MPTQLPPRYYLILYPDNALSLLIFFLQPIATVLFPFHQPPNMVSSSSSVCGPLQSYSSDSSDSREPTPEYDPTEAHNAVAPLHWDAEDFDFTAPWSEDDASLTDGEEGLQFLGDEDLEEDSADDYSWEGDEDIGDDADDSADNSNGTDDSLDNGAGEEGDAGIGDDGEDDDDSGDDDTDSGGGSSSSSGEDGDDDLPPIKRYRRLGFLG